MIKVFSERFISVTGALTIFRTNLVIRVFYILVLQRAVVPLALLNFSRLTVQIGVIRSSVMRPRCYRPRPVLKLRTNITGSVPV